MESKKALAELSRSLRDLHHALVQVERRKYEKEWGLVEPAQLLQLLTRHPDFEWLHSLSEFIVQIDEMQDEEALNEDNVRAVFAQASRLITPQEPGPSDFGARYLAALQDDPALVMAHVAAKRVAGKRSSGA
jgi:hypothetical protein